MPTRMVALDIDGTLTDSSARLAPRTITAARAAREAGLRLVLATGRRFDYAYPIAADLGFAADDVLICSTGTVVRRFDRSLLQRTPLSLELAQGLARALQGQRDTLVYTFDDVDIPAAGQVPDRSLLLEEQETLEERIPRWMDFNRADIAVMRPIEDGLRGREPIQAMVCGTIEQMRATEHLLTNSPVGNALTMLRTEYPSRDLAFMDILPAGTGKGTALQQLMLQWSFAPEEIVAIGDNHNDLDMLRLAGRAFVMANASPGVLDEAAEYHWAVCGHHDEGGAAEVLEMLAEESTVVGTR